MPFINDLCMDIDQGGLCPLFFSYPVERMSDEQLEKVLDEESRYIYLSERGEHFMYWPVRKKHHAR